MKERLVTAAGAVLALLIVYVLFFQKTPQAPVTRPLTTEAGRNGYSAVSSWLEASGVPVASFRQRYDRLIDTEAPDDAPFARRGNVLITTMPHLLPVRAREHEMLRAWVRTGNTLLVMAALDDTPDWTAQSAGASFLRDLEIMTGLRFISTSGVVPAGRSAARASPIPRGTAVELEPVGAHPLMAGVESLRGYSDDESALWQPAAPDPLDDQLLLRIAAERSSGLDAAWQRVHGDGLIIVAASGTLLANHLVAESDSGRFLANIVRHHLADDGVVIFDDMHQGLSVIYDAAAFYRDSRFHYTMSFLIAAWLVYLLGSSNRLAPPAVPRNAPRQHDFLEAVGGFMARRLDRRDAAVRLMENWFDEVRRSRALHKRDEPPWDELRATPTLPRETYARLRKFHERLSRGRAVDLIRLHNTLKTAREAIG